MAGELQQSWVESANGAGGFGLNHLPFGAFAHGDGARLCVAVGDSAVDLWALSGQSREFDGPLAGALRAGVLNPLLDLGPGAWRLLRQTLQRMLDAGADAETQARVERALRPRAELVMVYPLATRGYIDFYASIDHARRVGELFRPDNPLLPNYRHVPIGYNGRASSLVVSGTKVRRPWGQQRPGREDERPGFGPTAALDYELELGCVVGHGNLPGEPILITHAASHLFGVALLNDWSARDVQAWEYQPLGPFLGKSFATSVSAWITPMEALEPFRVPARERGANEPRPLPYLSGEDDALRGGLDLRVEVLLSTARSRAERRDPMRLSAGDTAGMFWTPGQMVAHATSNGCALETGDVLATGTISGAEDGSAGCLMELTHNGAAPLTLANGETRRWLEDGDEVILRGWCEREGVAGLVLGECRGRVVAAHRDIVPRHGWPPVQGG